MVLRRVGGGSNTQPQTHTLRCCGHQSRRQKAKCSAERGEVRRREVEARWNGVGWDGLRWEELQPVSCWWRGRRVSQSKGDRVQRMSGPLIGQE